MPRMGGCAKLLAALTVFCAALAATASAAVLPIPRYGHASALLPNGKILVVGGSDSTNTPVATAELIDTLKGSEYVVPMATAAAASMSFARSSATINVLPNGKVLVTGGWDGAIARTDAEVYDPTANTWTTVGGMSAGRFNHTATLLNTGNVLVCGGQTGAAAVVTATCDLFTPSGASGSFAATGSLLAGRELHTATMLNDGTVWIAGGYDGSNFLVTTERYSPASGQWQQAQVLNTARAYHTATLTGDNKVVVAGGFNGRDVADSLGFPSNGFLGSSELFDPTGGAIVPGPPMQARVSAHTALLKADGELEINGGVGNITTTHLLALTVPPTFNTGSSVSGSFTGSYSNHVITGGTANLPLTLYLGSPVTGKIVNGDIEFVNPTVTIAGNPIGAVTVTFVSNNNVAGTGLRASLAGTTVSCDIAGVCGYINAPSVNLSNVNQGSYRLAMPISATNLLVNTSVTGKLFFAPSPADNSATVNIVAPSSFTSHIQLVVPDFLAGQSVSSVTLTLSPQNIATWSQASSYTVTLNGGSGLAIGPYPVITVAGLSYIDIPAITINNVTGIFQVSSPDAAYTISSPVTIPMAGSAALLSSFKPSMQFAASGIVLDGATLGFSNVNVTIRTMVFGDNEYFDGKTNQWSFQPHGRTITRPGDHRFGASAILLPGDDEFMIGGRDCSAGCASFVAATNGGLRSDTLIQSVQTGFAAGTNNDHVTHAFHTASLLPNGTVLLAGGTDGSSVLQSAEIFDPAAGAFAATASGMQTPREQHTATLLPNGRVLLAGGFSATGVSTGPTNTAEIYYPDAKVFIPTSVMASSRSQHVAIGLPSGDIFVAGGFAGGDPAAPSKVTGTAEIYYSTAAAWFSVAAMPSGKERAIAAAVQLQDGRIMLCGGTNQTGILATAIAFNPATNSWSNLASMPSPLQGHTATLLPDGRVLVAGGDDGYGETTSSLLYDPVRDSWITTSGLNQARFGHVATLLPNGTVMVSGGVQQSSLGSGASANAVQGVEFFHPDAASWVGGTSSPLSLGARAFHTVTLAPNGNVYFIGGANGSIATGQSNSFYKQYEVEYFTSTPDGEAKITPSLRQSTIAFTTASPFLPGSQFTATGLRFRGATEGSGGAAGPGNSSFNSPHLLLQKIDGSNGGSASSSPGFIADLSSAIYANAANQTTLNTSLTVTLPATSAGLPYGWYMTWVGDNGIFTAQAPMVQVGPAKPASAPSGLIGLAQGTSSVTWTWNAVAGVDGYEVFQASSSVFLGTVAASGFPSFVQSGLSANTTASVLVAGYKITGDGPLALGATVYTLPNTPVGVQIGSVTFNSLMLQWNTNGNLPGTVYAVSQSRDGFATDFSTPVPTILGVTASSAVITQLQPDTTYSFRVQAFNTVGVASNFSVVVSTLTRASVRDLAGSGLDANSISWQWTDVHAGNYKVYNSTSGELIAVTSVSSFTDTGLGVATARSVVVSAVTAAGEGPVSASATSYTLANPPLKNSPELTTLTTASFSLGWSNNGNPNGTVYDVNLFEFLGSTFSVSSFTTSGFLFDTSALGLKLHPSVRYDVYVYAYNGQNKLSLPIRISTYTNASIPQFNTSSVPRSLLGVTPTSVSIQWDNQGNSTQTVYEVSYSTDKNFISGSTVAVTFAAALNVSSAVVSGLATSTTYFFRVRAQNPAGVPSFYSDPPLQALTTNGGAPQGSLAGAVSAAANSEVSGTLGNGRFVDLRTPQGAFPSDTVVTISSYDVTAVLCPNGLNVAVSITNNPALQPQLPVYFTASYTAGDLAGASTNRLALARFDPVSGTCVPLETSFDAANKRFTSRLNHFSLYQLVQVPVATSADAARLYPNPYRASRDGYVTVDNVPPGARVRVMTLRGETLLDQNANGSGLLTWSATNGSGRNAASGLYLVVIESGASKKILKLAVIR